MFWYVKNQFPFHSLVPIYIPQALTTGTYLNLLWLWTGWPILFRGPTQKTALAVTHLKNRERMWKKWRWIDREGKNQDKDEIPGSNWSMRGYILNNSKENVLSALGWAWNDSICGGPDRQARRHCTWSRVHVPLFLRCVYNDIFWTPQRKHTATREPEVEYASGDHTNSARRQCPLSLDGLAPSCTRSTCGFIFRVSCTPSPKREPTRPARLQELQEESGAGTAVI